MEAPDGYRSLSDVAFLRLRDAIIDGRLKPGQWLRQEALARELGMSQMPVREALRRLVIEGLAERIAYRGVRVVEFTAADVADMFTVRLVLESLAVRFATPAIAAPEIQRLKDLLRRAEGLGDAERNELAANAEGFVQQAKVEVVATQWRWLGRREEEKQGQK